MTQRRGVQADPDLGEQAEVCGRGKKVPPGGDSRCQKLKSKQTACFENHCGGRRMDWFESEGPTFCLWSAACDGLSPNGSEVWFLKWERRSRDTSHRWES